MPTLLNDMPLERADQLFQHPFTQTVHRWVFDLIIGLRQCRSYKDYVVFQQDLVTKLDEVQAHWEGARRVAARLRRGQPVPANAVELGSRADPVHQESWALEIAVCERADRHLRSIGDALAWRVFNYDRRVIVALSRNQEPGPRHGKTGLAAERDFVAQWSADDDCFVLLHDVTSCLRIADATLFRAVGEYFEAELHEIKANPDKHNTRQRTRQRLAEEAIRSGGPLPGDWPANLISLAVPYKTRIAKELLDGFRLAGDRGVQGLKVPGCRAMIAANLPRGYELWSEQEFLNQTMRANNRALKRAGILADDQKVSWRSDDMVARSPTQPPYAIYPLPPDLCMALISDMAVYVVTLSGDLLLDALDEAGLRGKWLVPPDQEQLQPGQPVLYVDNRVHSTEMRVSELQRLLLELTDLPTWIDGINELLSRGQSGTLPWPYFADEHKVWA